MPLLCSRLLPGRDSRDSWVGSTRVAGGRNQRRGTGTSLDHALSCRVPFLRMNGVYGVVAEDPPKLVPPYWLSTPKAGRPVKGSESMDSARYS